jgi:hypothetical protein
VQTDVDSRGAFVLDIGSGAWVRANAGDKTRAGGRTSSLGLPDGKRLVLAADLEILLARIYGTEQPRSLPLVVSENAGVSATEARS